MDTLFFLFSKIVWLFISPDSFLIIFFSLGIVLLVLGYVYWAKCLLIALLSIFLFIGLFPVGEWLLYPLEKQFSTYTKPENVSGIILLGGAEDPVRTASWNQPVLDNASERHFAFMELAKEYTDAEMIFTGGSGSLANQEIKGADVARLLYDKQGLNTSRIMFESESRNTSENVILSKKIAQPEDDETWVLITTAWHMPRSVGVFCQAEWEVVPHPVDYRSDPNNLIRIEWNLALHLENLKLGVKEWIGIASYKFFSKMC